MGEWVCMYGRVGMYVWASGRVCMGEWACMYVRVGGHVCACVMTLILLAPVALPTVVCVITYSH